MSGKILVVDDEEAVRFFAIDGLSRAGWKVAQADSGEAALVLLEQNTFDVMLLDLRMTGIDGLAVMRETKERWPNTMIIIMTAYASIDSAIEAVRQGAFDYLRKPCSVEDIISCANRAMADLERQRRQDSSSDTTVTDSTGANIVRSGALEIDMGSHAVLLAGQPVSLTPTEYGLLEILAEKPGQPVTLKKLIEDGLGYDPLDPQAQETLRVHISRLRRKLESKYIVTVRGGGYALANIPSIT